MIPASVVNLPSSVRMLDAVRAGLQWADEACFAVSFTRCSGLGLLIDPLEELIERKGKIQLLTSTYQCITQPAALEALSRLKGLECRVQQGRTGFHSKFWLFKTDQNAECWAGSSNISKGGLADNIEWNLRSTDAATVSSTREQFATLWGRPDVHPLTPQFIERYAKQYDALADDQRRVLQAAEPQLSLIVPNEAQREALAQLERMRTQGLQRAAIIAATGVGKTFLAAFDIQQAKAKSVLFVSHRLEHLSQARRTFERVIPGVHCEFHTTRALKPEILRQKWDYLVIDEFHHVEAPSYRPLREVRDRAFLLGLTATPERRDGLDILEWCDWNIAYEVRLPEAIERKWLLPFHYFAIADETIRFADIPWRNFPIEKLEAELSIPKRVDLILQQAKLHGFDGSKRATVGFCAGVRHAQYMAKSFNERGETALAAWGENSIEEREAIYARLADPKDPLQWLFVPDILNEGVDIPAINSLMFLRPTESASIFLQQLGRGLRLCPGTEVLTVLDFVGHHRNAWLTFQALNDITNTGARVEIGDFTLKPPAGCEVVLQRRTREMLAKIERHTTKRAACEEIYNSIKAELLEEGSRRQPLPVDLWQREGAPPLSVFRNAYKNGGGDWLACQLANDDAPGWAEGLRDDHPARLFLRDLEVDRQAQRVKPYAVLWGLGHSPEDPRRGYEAFFKRFPQWEAEHEPYPTELFEDLRTEFPDGTLTQKGLAKTVVDALGAALLEQIEGRLLYVVNKDFQERHGGILRTPAELQLHKFYRRPEIVRHFGVHYDPARHNTGMLFFNDGADAVIITKLDTSGAVKQHQYENEFESTETFSWTSQNNMERKTGKGARILSGQVRIHLFVAATSHAEACYVGQVRAESARGDKPMRVKFALDRPMPSSILEELGVEL